MSPHAAPLDTLRQIATPEGCEITLRVAGPAVRARAWGVDFLIRVVIWIAASILLGFLGKLGFGLIMVIGFVLEWLYPVCCEALMGGQTPGKKMFHLVTVHDDGTPVGWASAFTRNTLRAVDFFPFLYATGFICMMLHPDGKRLGDLAAGTLVVHRDQPGSKQVDGNWKGDALTPEAPPFPLTMAEQRALIEFARRSARLTPARAQELAEAAEPLTRGLHGEAAQQRLQRIAAFLLGAGR